MKVKLLTMIMILVVFAAVTQSVSAETSTVPGTYLLNQKDGYKQLLTLTPGKQAFSQNSGQFDPTGPFGDQQGSWTMVNGVIWVRTLDFITDPNNNNSLNGFGRSLFKIHQNTNGTLSGDVTVEIFPLDADPLNLKPTNVPARVFGPITFTGKRLAIR